jgi:hypothetical protein
MGKPLNVRMDNETASVLDAATVAAIKKALSGSSLIVEHQGQSDGRAANRFVCDAYPDLAEYIRTCAQPGDDFWFWRYADLCREKNAVVHGKYSEAQERTQKGQATSRKRAGEAPLGAIDFLDFVYDTQPDFSVLAVKAPFAQVVRAYKALRKPARWIPQADCKPAKDGDDVGGFTLAPFVKLRANPWTVMLRSVYELGLEDLEGVFCDAEDLSSKLKTTAVMFVGEDTSGALAFRVFKNGKVTEDIEWEDGGRFVTFKSKVRKKPKLNEVGHEFVHGVFRKLGIYLPACYVMEKGKKAWLAVEPACASQIERVDLVDVGERSSADDDED